MNRMNRPLMLWLGVAVVALGFWPRTTDTSARTPWLGPPGTPWAGTELRAMQKWAGAFSNVHLSGEYLELRCRRLPFLRTRVAYWPGPAWNGWPEWRARHVTYRPGWKTAKPKILPVSIAPPWWRRVCPD